MQMVNLTNYSMKRLFFSAILVCCMLPVFGQTYVDVTNYGATPDNPDDDDYDAISNALNQCSNVSQPVLYFPPGEYHLNSSGRSGAYFYINGLINFTVSGSDAKLTIKGNNYSPHIFEFYNCQNLNVQGLTIDYSDPPFSQGIITNTGGGYMDVELDSGFSPNGKDILAFAHYDPSTGQQVTTNTESYSWTDWSWIDESQGIVRVHSRTGNYQTGYGIVLRHTLYTGYSFIISTGCKNVQVTDVTVHLSPGYAFLANNGAEDITFTNCAVSLKSGFWATTTADASHNLDVRGTLTFENCHFEGMCDDGINLHGYGSDLQSISGSSLTMQLNPGWYTAIGFRENDEIEFLNKNTLESYGTATISSYSRSGTTMTIYTTGSIPNIPVSYSDVKLFNNSCIADLVVRGTTIRANRARGVLVSTKNALIENCTFQRNCLPAILFEIHLTQWNESTLAENVIIRNNVFDDCGYKDSGTGTGIVEFAVHNSPVNCNVFNNISITDNTFRNLRIVPVNAKYVNGLTMTGNTVENTYVSGVNLMQYENCMKVTSQNNSGASDNNKGTMCEDTPISSVQTFKEHSLKLYPIPSQGLVNIELQGLLTDGQWKIMNSVGQVVKDGLVDSENFQVNLMEKGIYFMTVNGKVTGLTKRIIIE